MSCFSYVLGQTSRQRSRAVELLPIFRYDYGKIVIIQNIF